MKQKNHYNNNFDRIKILNLTYPETAFNKT